MTEKEFDFRDLWNSSSVAPSFGIMRQTKTIQGGNVEDLSSRPFFYTPVYALWDAIETVRALGPATRETLVPILFDQKVTDALLALSAVHADVPSPKSHFPGPEASFHDIVSAMRAELLREAESLP